MSGEIENEVTVVITWPGGEWRWTGYAGNRTDALWRAQDALDKERSQ